MNAFREAGSRLGRLAQSEYRRYAGDADRPLGGYLGTMATYATVIGGLAVSARLSGREIPGDLPAKDVALFALATHKLSRLLAKDPVTSPLRAPFTAFQGTSGPAELREQVRGSGARKTVGELVTCPFCVSVWVATAFTAGLIYLPRATRLAMATLAALAGADMLHFAHGWLQRKSS